MRPLVAQWSLWLSISAVSALGCSPDGSSSGVGGASGNSGRGSGGIGGTFGGSSGAAGGAGGTGNAGGGGNAGAGGSAGVSGGDGGPAPDGPGAGPWVPVPADQISAVCRLDPQKLSEADAKLPGPWAVVRYGRLCYESPESASMQPSEAWSTTKTLGATVAGAVAFETRALPKTGPMTGPFTDADRADYWLGTVPYNAQARVAHVLAMVAHNPNLALGQKPMQYDTIGTTQINSLSGMLNAAVRQDSARLGADLEQFTRKFVYGPLGMTQSTWSNGTPDKVFAFSWSTTVRDMARIGLLLLRGGSWSGKPILDREWVYRMTHPAFEDSNTGYGYLTWLNASSNHHFGGIPAAPVGLQQQPLSPGPCAPVSVYPTHPHGLSDAPDCNYSAPFSCSQPLDVGVWQAVGLGGQVIQGHPGLDLLVIARDVTPAGTGPDAPAVVWNAVRPAVIALDPRFPGDDAAFCQAYGSNNHAPDKR